MNPQTDISSGLLLDTHIWIWLFEGSTQLNNTTITLLDQAAQQGKLFLPAIAVWELSTLIAKKRLTLSLNLKDWVEEALSKPGMALLPLTPIISMESTLLPGT